MKRESIAALMAAALVAGCAPAQVLTTPEPGVQPAPPPPTASHIPAHTVLAVELNDELSTRMDVGDTFTSTVQTAIVAQNGQTVVPAGAVVTGMITGVGGAQEQAAIRLNFTRIEINGVSHPFTADIISTHTLEQRQRGEEATRGAVTGAVTGAVVGAIIGGGRLRDILIGGALGAGAGTIISLGMAGTEQVLQDGTHLTLQTTQRVDLR